MRSLTIKTIIHLTITVLNYLGYHILRLCIFVTSHGSCFRSSRSVSKSGFYSGQYAKRKLLHLMNVLSNIGEHF